MGIHAIFYVLIKVLRRPVEITAKSGQLLNANERMVDPYCIEKLCFRSLGCWAY